MRDVSSGWRSRARSLESARGRECRPHQLTISEGEAALSLQTVHTEHAPAAIGPYSQGIIANGFLFTAGQIPLDPATGQVVLGDISAQTEQVFKNLSSVLGAAGASWTDVVKATVFLIDMKDFPHVNEVYARVMGDARPARSTVAVSGLPRGVMVEIDLIVAIPNG
jgi:2-iminobutanoate/2-iminopropanoate deaminase